MIKSIEIDTCSVSLQYLVNIVRFVQRLTQQLTAIAARGASAGFTLLYVITHSHWCAAGTVISTPKAYSGRKVVIY
jgi:hypothetical protein